MRRRFIGVRQRGDRRWRYDAVRHRHRRRSGEVAGLDDRGHHRSVVTLIVGPCAGFALASVCGVVAMAGSAKTIFATAIAISSLLSDAVRAGLTAPPLPRC